MATPDQPPTVAQSGVTNEKLTRFANVLGATFIGIFVTGLFMWLNFRVLGLGGSGVVYLGTYMVTTILGYLAVKRLTENVPLSRIVIVLLGLGAIAAVSGNWRRLGFEDPFVAPMIFAVFLSIAYWMTAPKPEQPN